MAAINPFETCPRCHGIGIAPRLSRTFFENVRELFRPTLCYVCEGAGEVQRSIGEKRMGELVKGIRRVMERPSTE